MPTPTAQLELERIARFPGLRALTWDGDTLYASRGYSLLRLNLNHSQTGWQEVGRFRPPWWRNLTSASHLTFRLVRDGFHALAVLPSGNLVAAVPGAVITLAPGETEFRVTHRVRRGTRPLHITPARNGRVFFGEYFDNAARDAVHIYASANHGATWEVAYTFAAGEIRHVHNIVYDEWDDCLWVLTGDNGRECRILRASYDFRNVDTVISGNQQARAVALVPTKDALYFSSDTPLESNYVWRLDRGGNLTQLSALNSSSIYGCRVGGSVFFTTMVEPSNTNCTSEVCLYGSADCVQWSRLLRWEKDRWPMKFFQYGNAFLPDGTNNTDLLAVTTLAVTDGDLETGLWRVNIR
jgi:hypothetical protein